MRFFTVFLGDLEDKGTLCLPPPSTIESFWDVFVQFSLAYKTKADLHCVTKPYLSLNSDS